MRGDDSSDDGNKSSATSKSLSDLKAEMKLLNWHKLANESALQAALLRTKHLRNKEKTQQERNIGNYKNPKKKDDDQKENERKRIVEEEKAKPLQIEEGYIQKIQQEDKQIKIKSMKEIHHLIQYIQQMKQKIQEREIRNFKKQEMQNIRNFMKNEQLEYQTKSSKLQRKRNRGAMSFLAKIPKKIAMDVSNLLPKSNLGNVLSSLEKIVELEQRIRELEANHKKKTSSSSSEIVLSRKNKKNENMKLIFSKQKTMSLPSIPSRMYHSVKMVSNNLSISNSTKNLNGSNKRRGNNTEQSSLNRTLSNVNSKFQEAKSFLVLRAQERKLLVNEKKEAQISSKLHQRNIKNPGKENIPRTLNSKIRVNNNIIKTNRNTSLFRLNKVASSHCGNLKALRDIKQNHFKRKEAIKKQTAKVLTSSSNKQRRITVSSSTTTNYRQRQRQQQLQQKKVANNNASIKRKSAATTRKKKKKESSFHLPRIDGNSIKTASSSSSSSTIKMIPNSNNNSYCGNKRIF